MSNDKFGPKENSTFASGGKYSTPKHRQEDAKASDFLQPAERKYPYKINGKPSLKLLRAAMSRAKEFGHTEIYNKAKRLWEEHS